jgi:hypothetical protein
MVGAGLGKPYTLIINGVSMQSQTFIDVIPQWDRPDLYQVVLLIRGVHGACPVIRNLSADCIRGRLEQLGWRLLRERFESRGRLENEEIDATPEQLEAFGFAMDLSSVAASVRW